jgi:hypothetical protein
LVVFKTNDITLKQQNAFETGMIIIVDSINNKIVYRIGSYQPVKRFIILSTIIRCWIGIIKVTYK